MHKILVVLMLPFVLNGCAAAIEKATTAVKS
jgi:hypothetical protein